MGKYLLGLFCAIMIILLFTGYFVLQQSNKDRRVEIKKVGKEWRVLVDSLDITGPGKKPILKVNGGKQITWSIKGSDAYFQFTIDSLFDGKKQYRYQLKDGEELKVRAKKGLKYDDVYAVFVVADKQYASQDSPPRIIIVP